MGFDFDIDELLKDKRVVEEINRHKWLESEFRGEDVGFEQAKIDWINKHAQAWVDHYWKDNKNKKK